MNEIFIQSFIGSFMGSMLGVGAVSFIVLKKVKEKFNSGLLGGL